MLYLIYKGGIIMPILSVIIPCYNSEEYIIETIDSVKNQRLVDWECIIVNDGSTDRSEELIMECISGDSRFRLISVENGGVGRARNIALHESVGKYVLPLDSDDILMPDYAFNGVRFLEDNPDYSLYYGYVQYFGMGDFIEHPLWINYPNMLIQDCICVSAIYRRARGIEVGGYNESLAAMEDYDFWIRYLHHNDKVKIGREVGFKYRNHSDSRHHSVSFEDKKMIRKEIIGLNKEIYGEYRKFLGDRYCDSNGI